MTAINPKVDLYIADGCGRCEYYATDKCKVRDWQDELQHLRQILLESALTEEVKWGVPVYTYKGKNVIIIGALRECVTIGFLKGVLIKDPQKLLEKQGKNVQSARILRFRSVKAIMDMSETIKGFIEEAISIEESGVKVEFKKNPEPVPAELEHRFEELPALADAFYALTPGKQRGYIIFISQPKSTEARHNRIDKCLDKIMNGEGLHDKYKASK